MLEACCLTVSANSSYRHTTEDIALLTGLTISFKTQQEMVQSHDFEEPEAQSLVQEVSIDGGTARLIPIEGEDSPCWKNYKAVHLAPEGIVGAWISDNPALSTWLNKQPLDMPLFCLGDGHDGIWNLFSEINPAVQRIEILDWYHLMENLEKVAESAILGFPQVQHLFKTGGSMNRLSEARTLLWKGKVDETIALFKDWDDHQAQCFCKYIDGHRNRIPNYDYYQSEEICSIGSGNIEATIKQIASRVKISGARWKREHLPKVLAQRTAYLNKAI
jgi:hypothetical protein